MVAAMRAVLLAVLLVGACGSPPPIVVRLPPAAGVHTFVMLVDEGLVVGTASVAVKLTGLEGRSVELALYAQPVEALGLVAGTLPSGATCASCALLEPIATFSRTPLATGEWERQPSLSEKLRTKLVPDAWPRCSCTKLEPVVVEIPTASQSTVVVALEEPGGSALLAVDDGTLLRVHPDLQIERICAPGTRLEHAVLGGPGRVWVATRDAIAEIVLADQRADAPCTAATSTTNALIRAEHMEAIGGQPDWLVLVTAAGSVLTFDGHFSPVIAAVGLPSRPVILSVGSRRAAVTQEESDTLHWIEGNTTRSERIVANDSIDSIAMSPEHGLVAVLELAGVAVRGGAAWSVLEIPRWGGSRAIIAYGNGIVSIAKTIVELSPRLEACPDLTPFTPVQAYRIARLGAHDIIIADITAGEQGPSAIGALVAKPWCAP